MFKYFQKIGYHLDNYWCTKIENLTIQCHCKHLNMRRIIESHGDLMDDFFDICDTCNKKFKVL